ncbi:MAG: hypothetical protein K2O91_13580 [Lachnospiraceae bacterium]|nr:hypothetical protein [Lachnospiraceae bacterium]
MKVKNLTILLFTAASALMIGGCTKQNAENAPEAALDLSISSEDPIEVDILSETVDNTPAETATDHIPEQIPTAEPESPLQNATPETPKTAADTSDTRKDETSKISSAVDVVDVAKAFQPTDSWTSDFFFQIPKDWSYTIDETSIDWGFLIQVNNQEDSSIRIYGQMGPINVEQFYTDAPTDFKTSNGLKGKSYLKKLTGEDASSYVDGAIVFDNNSYGVSFYMPENVYNEYKETLQTIFLSIKIEDIFAE